MGKGDIRTRRGKLYRGTHGKTRPKGKEKKRTAPGATPVRRPAGGSRAGALPGRT